MQRGLDLKELAAQIVANQTLKQDFIAETGSLSMQIQGDSVAALDVPGHGAYPILPIAHEQIGTHVDIPKRYYDKMLNEAPDLLATNVNRWFHEHPDSKRMVRTLGGDTRAFLSDRYTRIENEEIGEICLPILKEMGVDIVSAHVTDKKLYIHFVLPMVRGEVKVGDVVHAGGIISNSEVGYGVASVAGLLWRLWCLNGAVTGQEFSRRHVGRHILDNTELWSEETLKADDKAILLKMRDMVKAVGDETRFKLQLEKLKGLAQAPITGNISKAVEVLGQKVRATETEKNSILQELIKGGDLSAWGLVNAVTAQAHQGHYDRAVEFETVGGGLIELPAAEWKRVLEAE
jgi:hypothetical protein